MNKSRQKTNANRGILISILIIASLALIGISAISGTYILGHNIDGGNKVNTGKSIALPSIGEGKTVQTKSETLHPLLGADLGCCGNYYVNLHYGPKLFCTAAALTEDDCCPAGSPYDNPLGNHPGFPPSQGECAGSNYFNSAINGGDCTGVAACNQVCCYDNTSASNQCDNTPKAQCLGEGKTDLSDTMPCWTIQGSSEVNNFPDKCQNHGNTITCSNFDSSKGGSASTCKQNFCYWCGTDDSHGSCVPFCSSGTCPTQPNYDGNGNNKCTLQPSTMCTNGKDDDGDNFIDSQDTCCKSPNPGTTEYGASCQCPSEQQVKYNESECASPNHLLPVNVTVSGIIYPKYNKGNLVGCCDGNIKHLPTCGLSTPDQQISETTDTSNTGLCLCRKTLGADFSAYSITGPDKDKYCCGMNNYVIQSDSCAVTQVSGTIKFYDNANNQFLADGPLYDLSDDTNADGITAGKIQAKRADGLTRTASEYDPVTGEYKLEVPAGTYSLSVTKQIHGMYGPNSTQFTAAGTSLNVDLLMQGAAAPPPPVACTNYDVLPDITVSREPCLKRANITWYYPCIDNLSIETAFVLEVDGSDGAPLKTISFNKNDVVVYGQPLNFSYDYGLGAGETLEGDTQYTFKIIVNLIDGARREKSTSPSIIGNKECLDYPTRCTTHFCMGKSTIDCNTPGHMNEKQGTECDGVCKETAIGTTCIPPQDCKRLSINPAVGGTNVFGLYYSDVKDQCYGASNANPCYYDSYNLNPEVYSRDPILEIRQQQDTITDVCIDCKSVQSCFDYNSQEACEGDKDHCNVGSKYPNSACKWYTSADNFNSLGKGFCYYENYTKQDGCSRCGPDAGGIGFGVFQKSGCTPDLCSKLGSCIADASHSTCGQCGIGTSTCYDYTTQGTCTGDSCGLGLCNSTNQFTSCFKDGDYDGADDCAGLPEPNLTDCKNDYTIPDTILDIGAGYINAVGSTETQFTFTQIAATPSGDADNTNVSFCFEASETDLCTLDENIGMGQVLTRIFIPDPTGADTELSKLMNKQQYMYLRYRPQDEYKNYGDIKTAKIYVDTIFSTITITNSTTDHPGDIKSDLNLNITPTSEDIRCNFKFMHGAYTAQKQIKNGTVDQENWTDVADGTYGIYVNCSDLYSNNFTRFFTFSPDRNHYIIPSSVNPSLTSKPIPIFTRSTGPISLNFSIFSDPGNINGADPLKYDCNYTDGKGNDGAFSPIGRDGPGGTSGNGIYATQILLGSFSDRYNYINISCYDKGGKLVDTANMEFYIDVDYPYTNLTVNTITNETTPQMVPQNSKAVLTCHGDDIGDFGIPDDCNNTYFCESPGVSASPCSPDQLYNKGQQINIDKTEWLCFNSIDDTQFMEPPKCIFMSADTTDPAITFAPNQTFVASTQSILMNASVTDNDAIPTNITIAVSNGSNSSSISLANIPPEQTPTFSWTNAGITLFSGANTITIFGYTKYRYGKASVTAYWDEFGPIFYASPKLKFKQGTTNKIDYYTPLMFNISINDSRYTAMTPEGQSNTLYLAIIDNDSKTIISKTIACGNLTICNFSIDANPDFLVGIYNATFTAKDRLGNVNDDLEQIQFEVVDTGLPPRINITVFNHYGNPTTNVSAGHGDDLKDVYLVNVTVIDPVLPLDSTSITLTNPSGGVVPYAECTEMNCPQDLTLPYTCQCKIDLKDPSYSSEENLPLTFNTSAVNKNNRPANINSGALLTVVLTGPPIIKWYQASPTSPLKPVQITGSGYKISGLVGGDALNVTLYTKDISQDPTDIIEIDSTIPVRYNPVNLTYNINSNNQYQKPNETYIILTTKTRLLVDGINIIHAGQYFELGGYPTPDGRYFSITSVQETPSYAGGANLYTYNISFSPALYETPSVSTIKFYNDAAPQGWFNFSVNVPINQMTTYLAKATDELENLGTISPQLNIVYDNRTIEIVETRPSNNSYTNGQITSVYAKMHYYLTPVNNDAIKFILNGNSRAMNPQVCNASDWSCIISISSNELSGNGVYNASVSVNDSLQRRTEYNWSFTLDDTVLPTPEARVNGNIIMNTSQNYFDTYTNSLSPSAMINFSSKLSVNLTELNLIYPNGTITQIPYSYSIDSSTQDYQVFTGTPDMSTAQSGKYKISINASKIFPNGENSKQYHDAGAGFYFDNESPTLGTAGITILGLDQNNVSNHALINLVINAQDNIALDHAEISGDSLEETANVSLIGANPKSVQQAASINLTTTDGVKTFLVTLFDKAGNSQAYQANVTLKMPLSVTWIQPEFLRTNISRPYIEIMTNKPATCNLTYPLGSNAPVEMIPNADKTDHSLESLPAELKMPVDGGEYLNPVRIYCKSTYTENNSIYNIIADRKMPNITGVILTQGVLLDDVNRIYLITNMSLSGLTNITIFADEPVNCSYQKIVNNGQPEDIQIGYDSNILTWPVTFDDNQYINITTICHDIPGYPAPQRSLILIANTSAMVTFVSIMPTGPYINADKPTIQATTLSTSKCNITCPQIGMYNQPMSSNNPVKVHTYSPQLANGNTYDFTISCSDPSGNMLSNSQDFELKVDTEKPALNVTYPLNHAEVPSIITINGTATDNIGIVSIEARINGNDTAIGTAQPDTNGYFEIPNITFNGGINILNITATDVAGNQNTSMMMVNASGPKITVMVFKDGVQKTKIRGGHNGDIYDIYVTSTETLESDSLHTNGLEWKGGANIDDACDLTYNWNGLNASCTMNMEDEKYGEYGGINLTFTAFGRGLNGYPLDGILQIVSGDKILLDSTGPKIAPTWITPTPIWVLTPTYPKINGYSTGAATIELLRSVNDGPYEPVTNTTPIPYNSLLFTPAVSIIQYPSKNNIIVTSTNSTLNFTDNYFHFASNYNSYNPSDGSFYHILSVKYGGATGAYTYNITFEPSMATTSGAPNTGISVYSLNAPIGWFEFDNVALEESANNSFKARPYDELGTPGVESSPLNIIYDNRSVLFVSVMPSENSVTNQNLVNVSINLTYYLTPLDTSSRRFALNGTSKTTSINCTDNNCLVTYSQTPSGTWLANGDYLVDFSINNTLNSTYAKSWEFTIDNNTPSTPIYSIDGVNISGQTHPYFNFTGQKTLHVDFSGDPDNIIIDSLSLIEPDGNSTTIDVDPNTGKVFDIAFDSKDKQGLNRFNISARRILGGEEYSHSYHEEMVGFIRDSLGPNITNVTVMNIDAQNVTSTPQINVTITAIDTNELDYASVNGAGIDGQYNKTFGMVHQITIPANLTSTDGAKGITVTAYDKSGNPSQPYTIIVVLATPLEIEWKLPYEQRTINLNPEIQVETNKYADCMLTGPIPTGSPNRSMATDDNLLHSITIDPPVKLKWNLNKDTNNDVNISCMGKLSSMSETFDLIVDNKTPTVEYESLTSGLLLNSVNGNKEYLITDLTSALPWLNITMSEKSACSYTLTDNGTIGSPIDLGENVSFLAGPIVSDLQQADNTVVTVNISCHDIVGYPAITKTIVLTINSSAMVGILNPQPMGYENNPNPKLSVSTNVHALCTAQVSQGLSIGSWIWDALTLGLGPVNMDSNDSLYHTINVADVAGGLQNLKENYYYEFKIICTDIDQNNKLLPGTVTYGFTTDYTKPAVSITSPANLTISIVPNQIYVEGYATDTYGGIDLTMSKGSTLLSESTDVNGEFNATIPLTPGLNTINVSARDLAGNVNITILKINSLGLQPCILVDGRDGDCLPSEAYS